MVVKASEPTCTANHRVVDYTSGEGSSRGMGRTSEIHGFLFLWLQKAASCLSLRSDEPTCPTCAGLISTVYTPKAEVRCLVFIAQWSRTNIVEGCGRCAVEVRSYDWISPCTTCSLFMLSHRLDRPLPDVANITTAECGRFPNQTVEISQLK